MAVEILKRQERERNWRSAYSCTPRRTELPLRTARHSLCCMSLLAYQTHTHQQI
uniref:Uncharacterized protein n=1 Tax=Anguilla anguilla TaxID=7936 RepID=A0A0E9Q687_ANGAN